MKIKQFSRKKLRSHEFLEKFEQKFEIFVKFCSSILISEIFEFKLTSKLQVFISDVIVIYFEKPYGSSTFYSNISRNTPA